MTGNLAFETVVAFVASIDRGCQSRSFISRIDSETCACAGAGPTVASTRNTSNDANAMRVMEVLPGVSLWQVCTGYQTPRGAAMILPILFRGAAHRNSLSFIRLTLFSQNSLFQRYCSFPPSSGDGNADSLNTNLTWERLVGWGSLR